MKSSKQEEDDQEFYQNFLNLLNDTKQSQKRNHVTFVIPNQNNFKNNQEHQKFTQKMKQSQQILTRKLDKQKESLNELHQEQDSQNQQNQQALFPFSPPFLFNSKQKPPSSRGKISLDFQIQQQNQPNFIKKQEVQQDFTKINKLSLEICSACLLPKQADHQCNDEYGLISCPYCGDHIVRNFLNDHLVDCIPYIENQFKNLETIDECSICTLELTTDLSTLHCTHTFHKSCIDAWKMKTQECPVCRKPI